MSEATQPLQGFIQQSAIDIEIADIITAEINKRPLNPISIRPDQLVDVPGPESEYTVIGAVSG